MTDELSEDEPVSAETPAQEDVPDPESAHELAPAEWLAQFLREHRPKLVGTAARKLRDFAAAEDVVHTAMINVQRWMMRYPGRTPSSAYVYTAVGNAVRDWLSKSNREVCYGLVPDRDLAAEPDIAARLVAEQVLADLPPAKATAFSLQSLAGFTSAEAGAIMAMPAPTVRWHNAQAADALRRAIRGTADEERGTDGPR